MYVVAGSPRAMRAVSRAALCAGVDDQLLGMRAFV